MLPRVKSKKAKEVAKHMPDKGLVEKLKYEDADKVMRELTGGRGLDAVDMFKNIGWLKNGMDELDPNYIFWINCREINNEPSYVFKTSHLALQLALKMDPEIQNDKPSSMVEEYAYLDGMHTRVKGYVTLVLWTYHPGLCKVMRLASMECERENTECIAMFLDLFNKALQNKTGNPQYKFNPAGFMVDENGANFNAIERVLGMDVAAHTVTCQWHFMSCGKNHIKDINMNERETFKTLYQKICYTYTQHEYDKTVASLKVICTRNGIANWWMWWEVRRFHIVPAF